MSHLSPALRELVESGPLAHLTTINRDGSPQVTVIWIGLDGEDIVSAHLSRSLKVKNVERDPRVALSFLGPRDHDAVLSPTPCSAAPPRLSPATGPESC